MICKLKSGTAEPTKVRAEPLKDRKRMLFYFPYLTTKRKENKIC